MKNNVLLLAVCMAWRAPAAAGVLGPSKFVITPLDARFAAMPHIDFVARGGHVHVTALVPNPPPLFSRHRRSYATRNGQPGRAGR
jgi:hypothetical protein